MTISLPQHLRLRLIPLTPSLAERRRQRPGRLGHSLITPPPPGCPVTADGSLGSGVPSQAHPHRHTLPVPLYRLVPLPSQEAQVCHLEVILSHEGIIGAQGGRPDGKRPPQSFFSLCQLTRTLQRVYSEFDQ